MAELTIRPFLQNPIFNIKMLEHPSFIHHKTRLKIRGYYGRPANPAYSLRLLTEKLASQAVAARLWYRVKRYDLRPFDPEDLDEEGNERAPRAVSLQYNCHFEDRFNRRRNWISYVSIEEQDRRDAAVADYEARKATLEEKPAKDRTDDDKAELSDLELLLSELAYGGGGYLEEVPDAFGDGVSGLYHSLSAPNVPTRRVSKWKLAPDTPFCVRLMFYKPHKEQADWKSSVEFGRFRLEFGESSVEFIALNPKLTPAQVATKEARLKELLNNGRVTRDDEEWKAEKKREIAKVKLDAKKAGRSGEKLTPAEKLSIKFIEEDIDARWEEKRLQSGAEEVEIKKLQKEIYETSETVSFGQNFESFFNLPFVLTLLPQKRGWLTIQLEGAQSWSHEVRDITKNKRSNGLWGSVPVEIKTNGGAYKWNFGWPLAKPGQMVAGPLDPGFALEEMDLRITGQYDGGSIDENGEPHGARVEWTVPPAPDELLKLYGSSQSPQGVAAKYAVVAALFPGPEPAGRGERVLVGQQLPFVYDATLFVGAGERDGSTTVVWDSRDFEDYDYDGAEGISPIREVKPSWDEKGALACDVELRDVDNELGLAGIALEGRMADLWIDDVADGAAPFLVRGLIRAPQRAPEKQTLSFTLTDARALLDETMTAKPIGDGLSLGAHVADVLRCRGETEAELAEIDGPNQSFSTGQLLDGSPLGSAPAHQPGEGSTYARYLDELLETLGLEAGGQPLGLHWHSTAAGGVWRIEGAPGAFALEWTRQMDGQEANRSWVREVFDEADDDSSLFNIFTVEGARDPVTGVAVRATYTVWESILVPTDNRYIGREKPYQITRSGSIRTKDGCYRAAIGLAARYCRGVKFRKIKGAFLRELRPGLEVRAEGERVLLVRCLDASMRDDEMTWLALRLAPIPN